MNSRIEKDIAYKQIEDNKQKVASDPYRLHYHIMPPVGLLNDPNGFVFFKGQYHIFYQWNPFATNHGPKFWGHSVSEDLVHWREAPIALAPDKWYDKNGCYSGSAIVFQDKIYVFYTGNVIDDDGNRNSYQCMAVSIDGVHFEKKGPVIHVPDGYTAHFRDPKVFFNNGKWFMVLGAQTEKETGEAVLYTSSDLKTWIFKGTLLGAESNGGEDFGYMWECPDIFRLGDKDILLVCPQGIPARGFQYQNIFQSGYFAGQIDYDNVSFLHDSFVELDRGFDFYAPQTTVDKKGRRLLFGWLGNAEVGESKHPTVKYNWIHALTIPRYLEWKDGKLWQCPVKEIEKLYEDETYYDNVVIDNKKPITLPYVYGNVFAMKIGIKNWQASKLIVQIGESNLIYDQTSQVFTFQRKTFTAPHALESRHCVLKNLKEMLIFKDTSSMEIFLNDGEEVFSSRIFDDLEAKDVIFKVEGSVTINIKKWNVKKITKY
ncbi:glycoside hydrolase family 32 protein [Cerasibacillus sp. JNUCC 74]